MKQLYPDLWQSSIYSSGMLNSYAYLLTHPDGNVLFYNTGNASDLAHIDNLGGIKYQFLSHRDEAGNSLKRIREQFNSKLMYAEQEAIAINKYAAADLHFSAGDHEFHSIEVIATPGHTDGSLCFLYQSPHGKRYLFTGDTFFQWNERWATLVINSAGGSESLLIDSLKKLRDLKPDVVMSSGYIGSTGIVEPTDQQWVEAIDTEIARLKTTL